MKAQELCDFGMTEFEARIFIEILMLGDTKIGPIVQRTRSHRGTVYNALQSLISKNFVVITKKARDIYYKVGSPEIFSDIVDLELRDLQEKKETAKRLAEEFVRIKKSKPVYKDVTLGFGAKAYLDHFRTMFRTCSKKKISYSWVGNGTGNTAARFGEHNYRQVIQVKKEYKVNFRSLMNLKASSKKHPDYAPNDRYLPEECDLPAYIWLYDNKVVIVSWDSEPVRVITIEDGSIATTLRNMYELLYSKVGKPAAKKDF